MENIYFNCILTKKIVVPSKFLNENINDYIDEYLKNKIEGVCIDEGYVEPNSIKVLKKSVGMLLGSKFTGDITYDIAYTANVCNPVIGNVIECKVKFINKLGILGNNGPITIIVGKQFHLNDDDLSNIKEGTILKVVVIAKKFFLNDREIKIIAKLWNTDNENKKEFTSSDLTPIIPENDFLDIENQDITIDYESDENEENDYEEENEDDEFGNYDEEENIKMENPDDNLEADDIELEDEEENYDEDENDFE